MKILSTRWFVPSVMGLLCSLLLFACTGDPIKDPIDNPPGGPGKGPCAKISDPGQKCACLQSGADIERQMVLVFHDTVSREKRTMILDSLTNNGKNTILNICNERVIILESQIGIDPNAQYQSAKKQMDDEGTGWAGRNFKITLPPNETFLADNFQYFPVDSNLEAPNRPADPVIVGVVDMGFMHKHIGLNPFLWHNIHELPPMGTMGVDDPGDPNDFVDDIFGFNFQTTSGLDLGDASGHGTHVSGIIALPGNNAAPGTDYASSNKDDLLRMMMLTIADQGTGESTLAAAICAITYALDNGADVLNLSWGYYADQGDPALKAVLEEAKSKGVVVVASAGNDAVDTDLCHHWPSGYAHQDSGSLVVSVAALEPQKKALWPFSNYGKETVTVAAVGQDVYSTVPYPFGSTTDLCLDNTGTSMAAPYVSRFFAVQLVNHGAPIPLGNLLNELQNKSTNPTSLPTKWGKLEDAYQYKLECP